MHTLQLAIYIPTIFSFVFLGLIVILNNPKNSINKAFLMFVSSLVGWLICLFIADISTINTKALLFVRSGLIFVSFMPFLLLSFANIFPDDKPLIGKRILTMLSLVPTALALFAFSPSMVGSVEATSVGAEVKESGIIYSIFSIYLIIFILGSFLVLIRKKSKLSSVFKNQINIVILGITITAFVNIVTNILLVSREGASQYGLYFGIPSLIVFVSAVAYSIIRHKLFDIRLVVARTIGYILSIGVLALVYGVLAFSIIDGFIFTDTTSTTVKRATFTMLAVILAISYQPLKKRFDKITNKIFYRDAYDSQELLDNLNRFLVSTLDINKLLKNSAEIMNQAIRAEYIVFGIKQIEGSPQRIIGTKDLHFSKEDIEQVRKITPLFRKKSIIADELEETQSNLKLLLTKNEIAVMIRLTDTPKKNQEGLGYIVLGNKKSGGMYSKQDVQVLEIIADILVIAIQNALRFEEIQSFNITLQDKVNDATKKLRSANNRLVELDQTKDDFISMASHQLRTPLTTIKGYLSMIMEGDAGKVSKQQLTLLDQAFISSQRMVYLIADLLNVSRLRTGKFVIDYKKTNLADVIKGEILQLTEIAKGRNLTLTYNKPTNFPDLMLDETKIRQVIMNFADNAIYYTPSGGNINITLEDLGNTIEFTVIDDGIGVPKAEQHHLFNKFYRAGNAKKARPDGTGLGLFMAKKVVIAQGGSIIFSSQENKGSTFGFSFNKQPLLPENFKGV